MAYQATVCYLNSLKPHPNADRLVLANALGYNYIGGLDTRDDVLGVVFPSDGKLSHDMLMANGLYRKDPSTGVPMGGYFEPKGRVKTIKLRGQRSECFWIPLDALGWTGYDIETLQPGDTFDTLNDHKICSKYFTPATKRMMKGGQTKAAKPNYAPTFARHSDTPKVREVVTFFTPGTQFTVTEKLHGTSGRTGRVLWTKKTKWQNILSKIGLYKDSYRYVTGTRKVIIDPDKMGEDKGFYKGTFFRTEIHRSLEEKGLKKGEIIYYEIVGYTDSGSLIMGEHPLDKSELKNSGIPQSELDQYSVGMRYTYGCAYGEYDMYVYRITQDGKDLTHEQVQNRCEELGLKTVPFLGEIVIEEGDTVDTILEKCEVFTRGSSTLDPTHIKEGIVLRQEGDSHVRFLKYKGFLFCTLEGIRKNSDTYIDLEEVS
jgi:hypothetical protein